jgi:hypothetical protein
VSIVPVDIPTSAARVRAHAAAVRPTRDREFVLAGSAATAAAPRTASGGSAAVPAVVALADRVRSALSFYRNRPGAARISTVCVSGAGMAAEGVRGELARVLDVSPQTVTAHAIVSLRGAAGPSMDLDLNLVSTIAMTMVGSRR